MLLDTQVTYAGATSPTQHHHVGIDHPFVGRSRRHPELPTGAPFKGISADLAPYTGTWRPETAFSNVLGAADGTWTLSVRDTAGADTGSIRAFALHVSGFVTGGS